MKCFRIIMTGKYLLVACCIIITSCNKEEKKFDEFLQASYHEMKYITERGGAMCTDYAYAWVSLRNSRSDEYIFDFVKKHHNEKGYIDSIDYHKKYLSIYTSQLDKTLDSRKDCFKDYMEMYMKTIELARLAESPGGSINYFATHAASTLEDLKKDQKRFEEKYKDFLH